MTSQSSSKDGALPSPADPRASRTAEPSVLRDGYALAESISRRDHNNLYLTSRFFRDPRRYEAFCAFYAVMRIVDDRVDEIVVEAGPGSAERAAVAAEVEAWRAAVRGAYLAGPAGPAGFGSIDPRARLLIPAFRDARGRFPVPLGLWESFFAAMRRDLAVDGFATFDDFLRYTEGASVAPTTVYLILLSAQPADGAAPAVEGPFALPRGVDVFGCGRELGRFAYLVHILRDLPRDLATGAGGLWYLADEDLAAFDVSREDLRTDLQEGRARASVRRLLAAIGGRARRSLAASERLMASIVPGLTPDCGYVLRLIVNIYRELLERLEAVEFDPFGGAHLLTARDKERIAAQTAREGGY